MISETAWNAVKPNFCAEQLSIVNKIVCATLFLKNKRMAALWPVDVDELRQPALELSEEDNTDHIGITAEMIHSIICDRSDVTAKRLPTSPLCLSFFQQLRCKHGINLGNNGKGSS